MSYFFNNKLYHYYEVTDKHRGSGTIEKYEFIEIVNNESIFFDLTKLEVLAESGDILNHSSIETIKIHIDWGDGNIDRLSKPLLSSKSYIGAHKPKSWKTISHVFAANYRYEYITEDVNFLHKITITAYNSYNNKLVITIPYKFLYKTLYDLGSEVSLFSANTTNNNTVSYTLKQNQSDSMFIVNTLDWRQIYGDDEKMIIEESVSQDFADEFVNEDQIVWDWKSVPEVTLYPKVSEAAKTITCSFIEKNPNSIEEWFPCLELMNDSGNEKITCQKSETSYYFSALKKSGQSDFDSGVYRFSLNPLKGINGVNSQSDYYYKLYKTTRYPKQVRKQDGQNKVIEVNTSNKTINFYYTLPVVHYLSSLTKAELTLQGFDKSKDVILKDVKIVYDLLKPLQDKDGNPSYTSKNFVFTINMRDIPNVVTINGVETEVLYRASIKTNDVFGGEDNIYFYEDDITNVTLNTTDNYIIKNTGNMEDDKIDFTYDIGDFLEEFIFDNTDTTLTLSWKYKKTDTWDQFSYVISDINENVVYLTGIHKANDDRFSDLKYSLVEGEVDEYNFIKTLDGNLLPDGDLKVSVTYHVTMNDYYSKREKTETSNYTYEYNKPVITIDNVQPFISINYDIANNTQTLILNNRIEASSPDELIDIRFKIKKSEDDETKVAVGDLSYYHENIDTSKPDIDNEFSSININYEFSGVNKNDTFYRTSTSNTATFKIESDVSNMLILPSGGIDLLSGGNGTQYVLDRGTSNQMTVDWRWVKENTLHDIIKSHSMQSNGVTYFGSPNYNKFKFGETVKNVLYEVIELESNGKKIRRFMPYIPTPNQTFTNLKALPSASSCFNTSLNSIVPTYDKKVDKGGLNIRWGKNIQDSIVKDMWLVLNDGTGKEMFKTDVVGLTSYVFNNLDFGNYSYHFILNSEANANDGDKNKYVPSENTCSVFINPKEAINFSGTPIRTDSGDYVYITWKWVLNHLSCQDVQFYYSDLSNKTVKTFKNVREQNSFQPAKFRKTITDGGVTKKNIITYGFKMKSEHLDTTDYETDSQGYVKIYDTAMTI